MFLIILRCIYQQRSFITKRYLNSYLLISLQKLAKVKANCSTIFGCFLSYWFVTLNLLLIIICYPGILNPGPMISGLYHNVMGFVPFRDLNESVLPLSATKLQDFQSYLFNRNPGLVVLNETWLSNDPSDNEIFPNDSYKVFRLVRSTKTHPYDTSNPLRY